LISEFLASDHGAQTVQPLGAQGVSEANAQQLSSHAAGAAYTHVEERHFGLMGEHAGRSSSRTSS